MYEQLRQFPFEAKLTLAAKEMTAHIPFVDSSTIGIKVHEFIQQLMLSAGDTASTAVSYSVNLAIIPFITYFILAEGDLGIKTFVERIPNKYFEMSLNIMDKVGKELVSYLRGLILECSIVGVTIDDWIYDYRSSLCYYHWRTNWNCKPCSISRSHCRCKSRSYSHH